MNMWKFPLTLFALAPGLGMAAGFSSPSGNIICWSWPDDNNVSCMISEQHWHKDTTANIPSEPDCGLDEAYVFSVGPTGTAQGNLECFADVFWDYEATQSILPYGSGYRFNVNDAYVVCQSGRTGVTCQNQDGHGFTLRRAKYSIF